MTILGTVDFRAWDAGCFLTFKGELVEYSVDGSVRAAYVANIPGIDSGLDQYQGKVPMFFDSPEDPFQDFVIPSIVFKQNDATPAFDRQPWFATVARAPSKDAKPVLDPSGKVLGFDRYDTQLRADPFNFSYDMTLYARRAQELNVMKLWALRIARVPWFVFKVIDSLGDVREYDAGELSFSNANELTDIADRTASMVISFQVHGEVDSYDDISSVAMVRPVNRIKMGADKEV